MKPKRTRTPSAYTRSTIARIRRLALKHGAKSVSHIHPRAYCIAKPAPHFAVFVVPIQDREPQVGKGAYITVQHKSAEKVNEGDWCETAYLVTDAGQFQHVLSIGFMSVCP